MEAGRRFVGALVELGPGAHGGEHDLQRRFAILGAYVHRDAAAIVRDAERAVRMNLDLDVLAMAGQRLIDAVVHKLVDEVMQSLGPRIADVHAGPLADMGGVAQHLDVFAGVGVGSGVLLSNGICDGLESVFSHVSVPFLIRDIRVIRRGTT